MTHRTHSPLSCLQCYHSLNPHVLKGSYGSNSLSVVVCVVAQRLKRLPPMRETRVWSLGREDTLEKEMAIHSSILAWRIPWTEKPSRLQSTGLQRVGHDWATSPHLTLILCANKILQVLPILDFKTHSISEREINKSENWWIMVIIVPTFISFCKDWRK